MACDLLYPIIYLFLYCFLMDRQVSRQEKEKSFKNNYTPLDVSFIRLKKEITQGECVNIAITTFSSSFAYHYITCETQ